MDGMDRVARLPIDADALAPDGSEVRLLLALTGGSVAHFTLAVGEVSVAIRHRSVEEIWYVVAGRGEMWRRAPSGADDGHVVDLAPGTCIAITVGTRFQFRVTGERALEVVGVTMPPWPGDGEAIRCRGPWEPTVGPGPGLADE